MGNIRTSLSIRCTFNCVSLACCFVVLSIYAQARIDTLRSYKGNYARASQLGSNWEESIVFQPGAPVRVLSVRIHYTNDGVGPDTVRLSGDASEGTIPPTQYCYAYNTVAKQIFTVREPGWATIDFSSMDVRYDGTDRIIVQHVVPAGRPRWALDDKANDGNSYIYDPITPNSNFNNLPGIAYIANANYMVELVVEYTFDKYKPGTIFTKSNKTANFNTDGSIRADHVSVVDIDGDVWDDVVVGSTIFHNDKGTFKPQPCTFCSGPTVWADIDGDGDQDVFVLNNTSERNLFRNDAGQFTDVSGMANIDNDAPGVTALWLDFNHDGLLDLFIANGRKDVDGNEVYFQDKLYVNKGNWQFHDVTNTSGIAAAEPAPYFDAWGASLCDYNNDGWTDIFVATYRLAPDRLYRNNKDGTFTDVSASSGVQGVATALPSYFGHGMGSDWADVNNDGFQDLAIGNLGHPDSRAQYSNPSMLWMSSGTAEPTFAARNMTNGGPKFKEMNAGMTWIDIDNDGYEDLWHGQISYSQVGQDSMRYSHIYFNRDSKLVDSSWASGIDIHGAWTASRLDYDRDGDMDLICASGTHHVMLFRNDHKIVQYGNTAGFYVRLVQPHTFPGGAQAYGARVTITHPDDRTTTRWLPGTVSGGRASQSTSDLHFGVPQHVKMIEVTWPDGFTTKLSNVRYAPGIYIINRDGQVSQYHTSVPRLRSPANNQYAIGNPVRFMWHPYNVDTQQVRYKLDIAYNSPLFDSIAHTYTLTGTVLSTDLNEHATIYWRVSIVDSNDIPISASSTSSTWKFIVGQREIRAPRLISPTDGQEGVKPRSNIFTWSKSSFTIDYQAPLLYELYWNVNNDSGPLVTHSIRDINDTALAGVQLPADTSITWYVLARHADSAMFYSPVSEKRTFRTHGVPVAPTLISPPNGTQVQTTRPVLVWSRVALVDSGYEYSLDTNSDFSTERVRPAKDTSMPLLAPLKIGKTYYWRARAKNEAGPGLWSNAFVLAAPTTSVHDNASSPVAIEGTSVIVKEPHYVCISLFNSAGAFVATPICALLDTGHYSIASALDNCASGMYLIEIRIDGNVSWQKIIR